MTRAPVLLLSLGARAEGDVPEAVHAGIVAGHLSMRSFALRPGGPAASTRRST